ncbi:hypothetical protein MTO96_009846 [Rhipicephalus appendiculatus]
MAPSARTISAVLCKSTRPKRARPYRAGRLTVNHSEDAGNALLGGKPLKAQVFEHAGVANIVSLNPKDFYFCYKATAQWRIPLKRHGASTSRIKNSVEYINDPGFAAAYSEDVLHRAGAGLWGFNARTQKQKLTLLHLAICHAASYTPSGKDFCGPLAVLPRVAPASVTTVTAPSITRSLPPFVRCFQRPLPAQVSKPTVQRKRPFSLWCTEGRKQHELSQEADCALRRTVLRHVASASRCRAPLSARCSPMWLNRSSAATQLNSAEEFHMASIYLDVKGKRMASSCSS